MTTFAVACELQSFTRAAEKLEMTQAGVSQHVAALERELGVSLFERTGRSVRPSDAGRNLYGYVRQVLDLMDVAREAVTTHQKKVCGLLRIASSTVPAKVLLPQWLAVFRERFPEVLTRLMVSDSTAAAEAVGAGEAEVGFVGDLPQVHQLKCQPVGTDELVLAVSPKHPLAKKRRVTSRDLSGLPLVIRESGSGSRRRLEQALEEAGFPLNQLLIALECNCNDCIREAVACGIGAAFLSRGLIAEDLASGRLAAVPVTDIHVKRNLYLVTPNHLIPSAPQRQFLQMVEELARPH